jgi:hypothetical protein
VLRGAIQLHKVEIETDVLLLFDGKRTASQSIVITEDGLFGSSDPRRSGALTLGY